MWLFLVVCKEWQRNEHRIVTHAYTAILLFTVAVVVYLIFNSVK